LVVTQLLYERRAEHWLSLEAARSRFSCQLHGAARHELGELPTRRNGSTGLERPALD
jgi:hypothetical protein